MEKLGEITFYLLETAIKTYRQMSQRNITAAGFDITIDQWLVMKVLTENNHFTQTEIAEKVFKDAASVTRIIDMLIRKKYLTRETHDDRRRTQLKITTQGKEILKKVQNLIQKNRAAALEGIPEAKIKDMRKALDLIISNCKN